MKNIHLDHIKTFDTALVSDPELAVLEVTNSTIAIPAEIGQFKHLKELHLVSNTLNKLPKEILELDQTFLFVEHNEPQTTQQAAVLLFDLQRGKISKRQATVFLDLLQSDLDNVTEGDLPILIDALDYKVEEIRLNALELLDLFLPEVEQVPEKSVVTFLGVPDQFTGEDIKPRLKNVGVSYQTKLTPKTTHVVLCVSPNLTGVTLDEHIIVTTQDYFMTWLNEADKQLLSEQTEENKEALENVSAMLMGEDAEHIELALTMMKTHGVSHGLLTDLYIFYNKTDNAGLRRKAKTLFKKYAPKVLLNFFKEQQHSYYASMEGFTSNNNFYDFLEKNPVLDKYKIAKTFLKGRYIEMGATLEERVAFIKNLIVDGVLKIEWDVSKKTQAALKAIGTFETVVISSYFYKHDYAWLAELDIEKLDLYDSRIEALDDIKNFKNLQNLKAISLASHGGKFPAVLAEIPSLEFIEMEEQQFADMPEAVRNLTNLKTVMLHMISSWDKPISEEVMKEKRALLPDGCQIKEKKYGR